VKRILKMLGMVVIGCAVFIGCFATTMWLMPSKERRCMKLAERHQQNIAVATQCMQLAPLCVVTFDELEKLMLEEEEMVQACDFVGTTPQPAPSAVPQPSSNEQTF
jgi:hypothetical protein